MYSKVVFGTTCKTEDGKILGKEIAGFDGRIFFEDEKGNMIGAFYGVIDEKGELHTFCTNTKNCGKTCIKADSPCCRYNRKYQHTVGYYVHLD